MKEGMLLRVYISESARLNDRPTYKCLVEFFKEKGFPGCTVFRGLMGFGHERKIKTADIVRLSLDLPVIVDIVDTEEKVLSVLPEVEQMVEYGLVITQKVDMLRKYP